jgi:ribosomal protein S18 acetylase RimI-like enzyme
MAMDVQIREAMEADIEPLIVLSRRTISAHYRSFLGDKAVETFIDSGTIEAYIKDTLTQCSVLFVDGTMAGCCVTKDNVIDLIMIAHDLHRCGFGIRLLTHTVARLFQHYNGLMLESFEGNQKANNFYRKNGWKEVRRFHDASLGFHKLVFHKLTVKDV